MNMGIDMCTISTKFCDNPSSRSKVMKEIEENTIIKMAAKISGKNKKHIIFENDQHSLFYKIVVT